MFETYLATIKNEEHRHTLSSLFVQIAERYPQLDPVIKWNQPMFTNDGTFIIGFSVAKAHISVAPEKAGMNQFAAAIAAAGYSQTDFLFRIPWTAAINTALLFEMIEFNLHDKAGYKTFWR